MRIGMFALAVLCAVAAPVAAQPASKADQLFDEGRVLLEAGKYKDACAKFQASLDAADALGTRMNLALCMEKRGRVHSALIKFEDNVARAEREGQAESAKVAREHAAALRALVPTLTITTVAVPGQRIVITRPGDPDIEVSGTDPVPLDPTDPGDPTDKFTVTAEAPGYVSYTSEPRTIAVRAKDTMPIPALTKSDTNLVGPGPAVAGKSSKRKLGLIVGGTGLGLMAVGTLYGYIAKKQLDSFCRKDENNGPGRPCEYDADGKLIRHDTGKWNHLHVYAPTVFFVGVAAVGLGAFLYFTAPKSSEHVAVVPTIDPDGAGIAVLGHF